jgi:hypothetical protein
MQHGPCNHFALLASARGPGPPFGVPPPPPPPPFPSAPQMRAASEHAVRARRHRAPPPTLPPPPSPLPLPPLTPGPPPQIAVLEDSLLALWSQANGNQPPPPSLLKGGMFSAASGNKMNQAAKPEIKRKDVAALSMLKGELDSRLRSFVQNMSPVIQPQPIPSAAAPSSNSYELRPANSPLRHVSARSSSSSPLSRPRSRPLPPLTTGTDQTAADDCDPFAQLDAANRCGFLFRITTPNLFVIVRRLSRVLSAVGVATAAGGAAAAAAAAAAESAAAAAVGGAGRASNFVLFSEIEEEARPSTEHPDAEPASGDGVRSNTPATPMSSLPPPTRGATAFSGGGANLAVGDCWAALGAVISGIEGALAEELGCRWVNILPVSQSPFDAWVEAAKSLHGQTQPLTAPQLRLRGAVLKQQLKHDDELLAYPVTLMKCAAPRSRGAWPPLPPHIRIYPRTHSEQPGSSSASVMRVVDVGGGAMVGALEHLAGGGGSRLAGVQSVLRGSLESAAAAMAQKHYICNSEQALAAAWNHEDAVLLGSIAPLSLMAVPLVAGEGEPGQGELQALVVCGGKSGGFFPPHADLIRAASSAVLSAIHTGMQLSRSTRCSSLSTGSRSTVRSPRQLNHTKRCASVNIVSIALTLALQVQALLSGAMTNAAAISSAVAKWLPVCLPGISNALLFMRPEVSPSVAKAASHHRLSLNPKPNAPAHDVFFYCSGSSSKLMPFVQDHSAIALALAQARPLVGVCPIKSLLFAQLLKDAKVAAALAPTPVTPSTPAMVGHPLSSEQLIFGSEFNSGDGGADHEAINGLRADTPISVSGGGNGDAAPKIATGIFKAMAKIDAPDHSFVIMLPIANVAVLAMEVCDGACPDADLLEAVRGITACIDRCMDIAGVFESCAGSSLQMSAIASTSFSHAHAALLKASKRLLQCSIVQVYDVEWSQVSSGTRASDQIPSIRCITHDSTQTGRRGEPLPPGMGAVWRAVTRAELVLVRRCADDAVFRRGVDCPYECDPESAIVCPCVVQGVVVGAVSFVNKRSGLFLLGDTLAAETLSRGIGISIASTRAIASERARADDVVRGMTTHCASLVRTAGCVMLPSFGCNVYVALTFDVGT